MLSYAPNRVARRKAAPPWNDIAPVRDELFGIERLEQHAETLAAAQPVTDTPRRVRSLQSRLGENAAVLLAAYKASAAELESGRGVAPAAEWLLDNYHLVEDQIREIREDLPPGYYRQLPKLAEGPFVGYPRVFGLAWAFVAHTDSHFDPEILVRFVAAYQRVQPLTIGELWAVAITLRIVLIENLRRLAEQIDAARLARADAEGLANRLLAVGGARAALEADIARREAGPISELFAARLAKRLRDQDPRTTPALEWLEARLELQGSSVDEAVRHAQQRQGSSNVTVRNVITSMRLISDVDWAELVESVSLVDERLRGASAFAGMDFATRNLYRGAIEQLARGSSATEREVADAALAAARAEEGGSGDLERLSDPGYHLIADGRPALERAIGFRPSPRLWLNRFSVRLGIGGYVGATLLVAAALIGMALGALAAAGAGALWLIVIALLAAAPALDVAAALVNRAIGWSFGAHVLPGLDLSAGVPPQLRTLIAVPTLLTSEADLLEQIGRLEIHHLAGSGGELSFALVSDGADADQETLDGDAALLAVAADAIARLNRLYGPTSGGDRFFLLHRRRLFNADEGVWMGWERKRGKLHELNRLLRGATDTSFLTVDGRPPQVPAGVRYVITLDADTRLPRDAAIRLIGKMAHPLNRPSVDAAGRRVVGGYGILQPRVTPSLPIGREGSTYQRAFSAPGGIDPYAAAVSDVYQDLFGEGSYTGKGIYDVDAFEAALAGRTPDNAMLSHDLFEGVFARAGLASDVEVIEEFPARYDVAARRLHRWTRGDWQLLPWVLGVAQGRAGLPAVGRGKMLDNLRRSLVAPAALATLALCWLLPAPAAVLGVAFVVAALAIPTALHLVFALVPGRTGIHIGNHSRMLAADVRLAATQIALSIAFLPDQAWRMGDAIVRTLDRVFRTRRRLLEWTTAAQSTAAPRLDLQGFYKMMAGGTALGLGLAALGLALAPASWALILPFAAVWAAAPAIALWASRSPSAAAALALALAPENAVELRLIARRTWRFFETFVTPADGMLPPDNFQEDPSPVVARRTSPTNIGLYLLSAVAARDFGWAGTTATVERIEATFASLRMLPRHRGHFLNWYGTERRDALAPAYVSTVDSGNFAGHLIALAQACEDWAAEPVSPSARQGLVDDLACARQALATPPQVGGAPTDQAGAILDEIDAHLKGAVAISVLAPVLTRLADKAARIGQDLAPAAAREQEPDFVFWMKAFARAVAEHAGDLSGDPAGLGARLAAIATEARATALAMDFAFLLDPERKLLSIGYSLADNRLDPSCYDLLASEARLASLFAIAKGDVPTRHWFRLGRTATPIGGGSALISWSGSMFEYLMPSLVMRAPAASLLDETNRLVVRRQQAYGRSLGIPWGVSESAYNARDLEFTYQYLNFGVPGLGLKRGLGDNAVVAPYATGLAAMIDPLGACANFARLREMGAGGRYGFYEALDFTRTRLPKDARVALVRSYMAHHQGMTIVALANVLQDGRMRARFHREPMIKACDLLMHERMPRDVQVAHPRAQQVKASVHETAPAGAARHVTPSSGGATATHVLSNGRYAVMLTADGTGYSRWRDLAVTRWRADVTRDDLGSFVVLRDVGSGRVWSAGAQPIGAPADHQEVLFGEDHATFIRRDGPLTTTMDVLVSGEADGEVRRVKLANAGRSAVEIELTSYAEIVLAPPAADAAHPAFAKLFVETEHLAEFGALIATRRPRTQTEAAVCAAHFAVVEGQTSADPQYETDRARFLGRSLAPRTAFVQNAGRPLSNTVGAVLDTVFSIRRRVTVPPGGVVRVAFWTMVATSRDALLDLVDTHLDRSAFDRAKTLAWTQAQVQLRHLDVTADEAADFQRLAAPLLYPDTRFRATPDLIERGAGSQTGLWPLGISGDLPIVLLRIDDIQDMEQVRQLLRAHEYWRIKGVSVDLVIVNEHASSYLQDLQVAIDTAVRSSQSHPRLGDAPAQGSVHALRADLLAIEARNLIQSVARVVLAARRGPIAAQIARIPAASPRLAPAMRAKAPARAPVGPPPTAAAEGLEFFNGLGGFAKDGREYVTILDRGRTTPAPWINVIANPDFGFHASSGGSGFTWSENSRENQLTPWSNDPVADPAGEAIYVRDHDTGEVWTPTAQPICDGGLYVARHGFGYSRFEHEANGVALELTQYVAAADPIKISRLVLRDTSGRPRRLSVAAFAEWALGTSRAASAPFVVTAIDPATGALFARNPWGSAFPGRVAFADLAGRQTAWTGDRTEFLGRHGGPDAPAALFRAAPLSGAVGAGLDPCAALSTDVVLGANEGVEIVWLLGQCKSDEEARALVLRYREADLDAALAQVADRWTGLLGAVQVRTPDRAMDVMLNGWLLYQAIGCRIWARSGFYQASGAYGFRDQMQDGMALSLTDPAETRRHLLRAAGRQFPEGDVQHWWLPHSGQGVRTRISDDRVWLAYAAATYATTSGDVAVLDEETPFLDGPPLGPGEHDAFFQPLESAERATLFEHCARGLDQCVGLTGPHGLPLMGTGDWNDGMNRVGEGGQGESVWLGWLFIRTVALFAPLAEARDPGRAERWREHAEQVRGAIEREAWDGAWYRRATYDDGTWLGSATSDECRIDSIAQSWAVLSEAADPARAEQAMASLDQRLIRRDDRIAVLFEPPFASTSHDPGYIKGYPAGLRENGGQYSHAAMWAILAFAKLGDGVRAHDLFALLNPISHALDAPATERYKVEPYVLAADVYSVAPHAGRGGWTWYTGSAAWMHRAGIEGLLGIRREGAALVVAPCVPDAWPGFEATVDVDSTLCRIRILRTSAEAPHAVLDGRRLDLVAGGVRIELDARDHDLRIVLPRLPAPASDAG